MASIKKLIRECFVGELLISYLHCAQSKIVPLLISDERAVINSLKKRGGNSASLQSPKTFAEKIEWYKLNVRDPMMHKCVDKYAVREYVKSKGLSKTLNTLYGVYDNVEDIDFDKLPKKFVIKAAHGTHMGVIVRDKNKVQWRKVKLLLKSWMLQDIFWRGREWAYKGVPHRIVVEEYLEDEHGELRDYKFFCYHGEPYYMEYDIGRFQGCHYRNYYDMEKRLLPISDGKPSQKDIPFPLSDSVYLEMQMMARKLSMGFQQVRVDLYHINGKIYFGEMTFYDGNGTTIFSPDEWNYKFAEQWHAVKEGI